MKVVSLEGTPGKAMERHESKEASVALIGDLPSSRLSVIHLGVGGVLGRHPAATPQLMLVLSGSGTTRGPGPAWIRLEPGSAIRWDPGEEHETMTDQGMNLLVIEGDDPALGIAHP